MKIYIAGKITGDPNYKAKFTRAVKKFPTTDKVILPTCLPQGLAYRDYIRISLTMIDVADKVAFLPDWKGSTGSKIEHAYCRAVGKPVIYL